MLCAHPNIYIPPESNFILRFLPYSPRKPLSHSKAVDLVNSIYGYKVFFRDWPEKRPDPVDFVDSLTEQNPNMILSTLYSQYASYHDAQRWGDKSPIYATRVAEIAEFFPTAQFIHIIRDGRDVALSMKKAYQGVRFFYVDLCYAAQSWRRRVQKARNGGLSLGAGRYFELRYEKLTENPEATLKNLCHFLGETFVSDMTEPQQVANKQYHSKGVHASTRKPLNTKSVGRWQKKMPPSDQRIFQVLAGDLLMDLGYETVPMINLSLNEKARLTGLRMKYSAVETGRQALQVAGIVHPATLVSNITKGIRIKL
jgi:hypothetical protein